MSGWKPSVWLDSGTVSSRTVLEVSARSNSCCVSYNNDQNGDRAARLCVTPGLQDGEQRPTISTKKPFNFVCRREPRKLFFF